MRRFWLFPLVVLCGVCTQAATYYVSESGDDANDGLSSGKPFLSFDKGASMLREKAGNTLIVDEGLFSCETRVSLAPNSTVLGRGPGKTVLVFCGLESCLVMQNASERTLVKGFTFTTDGPHACGLYTGADRAELEDCVFEDALCSQSAFGVVKVWGLKARLKNVVIRNCTCWMQTGGFYLTANQGELENCRACGNRFTELRQGGGANGCWRDYSMTFRSCSFGRTPMTNAPSFWEKEAGGGLVSNCVFFSKNAGSTDVRKVDCRVGEDR